MAGFKINRTNDAVFNAVFAKHPHITLSLINAFFEFQGTELISGIDFIDMDTDGDLLCDKRSRMSIMGRTVKGEKVNIEIRFNSFNATVERAPFYGEIGFDMPMRTVSINILGFDLFDPEQYSNMHSCFVLADPKTGCVLSKCLEIHFLELRKVRPRSPKELSRMERWAAYFAPVTPEEELREIATEEPAIKEALEVETAFMQSDAGRCRYEQAEKFRRDQHAMLSYTRKQGMAAGRAEGRAEGVAEGKVEGKVEAVKDFIAKMLQRKKPLADIADLCDTTMDNIKKVAAERGLAIDY